MATLKEIKKRLGHTDKLSKEPKEENQPDLDECNVAYEPSDHPNYSDLSTFSSDIQHLSIKELNVLLDFTCAKGLHEHLDKLLERSDLDPNAQQGSGDKLQNYPLLKAALLGYHDVLRILKKDTRTNFKVQYKGDTILHLLLKRNETDTCNVTDCDYQECLDVILDNSKHNPVRDSIKEIVNKQDLYENTALHYATQKWPQTTVRKLLDFGANIGIKNEWQEIPISKIRPETIKAFLDSESCLTSKKDVVNENFSMTFHYDFLARDKQCVPKHHRIGLHSQAMSMTSAIDEEQGMEMDHIGLNKSDNSDEKQALPETESLWYMGQSKEHRHLLKHPVIASFLWYKWKRIRKSFNRNLRFYSLFVYLLTWYIFDSYGSYSLSKSGSGQSIWYSGMIAVTVAMLTFIWHDFMCDIKDMNRRKSDHTVTKSCLLPYTIDLILLSFMIVILILTSFSSEQTGSSITTSSILRISLIAMLCVLVVREFLQLLVSLKRYVTSFENWIEVSLIGLTFKMVCNHGGSFEENRHLAAITTFLAWAELVTMVGKHPKLHRLNIYVTMFSRVLKDFILFLAWYSMFIVAFGFGFYIMLHTDTAPGIKQTNNKTEVDSRPGSQTSILRCSNGTELEVPASVSGDQILMCPDGTKLQVTSDNKEEETYQFFNKTWLSLVKTSTMFIGELEFSDIPINRDSDFAPLSYLFLLLFVLLVVIILMNLLTGLAVGDIGEIRQKAEIYAFISQVETISYMESMMLGDPFDFLKNVPKVLSWIDSCSVCSLLYKFGPIRHIFLNIGSGILLFYDYLENKRSEEIKPNKRKHTCNHTLLSFGSCSCLSDDDMDGNIIASAKEIIVQRNRTTEEENREKYERKEKEIANRKIKEMDNEEEKTRHEILEMQLKELRLVIHSLKTCPCPIVKVKL